MKYLPKDPLAEIRRLIRFGGVGIVSMLVYSAAYATLAEATRLGAVPTSIIAYATAMVVSFLGHKYFTFAVSGNIRAQIVKFVTVHCACLAMTVVITDLVVDRLRWPYGVGIALVDIAVPLLSFLALKLVVFADKSAEAPQVSDVKAYRP